MDSIFLPADCILGFMFVSHDSLVWHILADCRKRMVAVSKKPTQWTAAV